MINRIGEGSDFVWLKQSCSLKKQEVERRENKNKNKNENETENQ